MKTNCTMIDLESRAIEALRALLGEVSVIKLKEIRRGSKNSGDVGILARIDVLGHSHTLACEVRDSGNTQNLSETLRQLRDGATQCDADATPVLIAPYLSPEAQALCKEHKAGFIDLEGNARLALGEFFIGKRSLAVPAPRHPSNRLARTAEPYAVRGYRAAHAQATPA